MPYWGKKFETKTEAEAELESLIMDYAQSNYPLKVYVPMNSQSNKKKPKMQKYYIDKSEKTKFVKFLRKMSEVYDKSDEDIIAKIKEIYNAPQEDYGLLAENNIYIFIYSVYSDIKNSLLLPTKKKKIFELIFTPLSKDTIYAELRKFGNGGEGGFKTMKRELSSPSSSQFERFNESRDPRSPVRLMSAESSMGKKRPSTKKRGRKKKKSSSNKSSSNKSNSNRNINSRNAYPPGESPTSLGNKGNKNKKQRNSSRKRKRAKKNM
jgi:hypothetical protein